MKFFLFISTILNPIILMGCDQQEKVNTVNSIADKPVTLSPIQSTQQKKIKYITKDNFTIANTFNNNSLRNEPIAINMILEAETENSISTHTRGNSGIVELDTDNLLLEFRPYK